MYYLHKLPRFLSNQRLILTNLSLTEIMFVTSSFVADEICTGLTEKRLVCHVPFFLSWYAYFVYLFAQLLLLLDRFIGATWPLKYQELFPKERAILAVVISWILGTILMIPRVHFGGENWIAYAPIVNFTLTIFIIFSAVFVYGSIACKARKRREMFTVASSAAFKVSKVPALIISTFVVLVALPELVVLTLSRIVPGGIQYARKVYQILWLNCCFDPVIYLYGLPPVRSAINRTFLMNKPPRSSLGIKLRDQGSTEC